MLLVLAVRVGGTGVSDASEARCVACAQANPKPVQSSQLARRRATRTRAVAAPMPLKHVGKRATANLYLLSAQQAPYSCPVPILAFLPLP